MFTHQPIKHYFQAIFIYRLRAILSTLGILFGIVAVVAMLSIGEGAKQETLEQIAQLGMNNIIIRHQTLSKDQEVPSTLKHSHGLGCKDVEALSQNVPYLLRLAPLKVVYASLTGTSLLISPEILAVTHNFSDIKELKLIEGRFLCDIDQKRCQLVCVLGYEIAKALGKEGHSGNSIRIENVHYQIVGILKPTYWKTNKNYPIANRQLDKCIFIPLGSERSLPLSWEVNKQGENFSEIILQFQNTRQLQVSIQLIKKILNRLHRSYENYHILIPVELLNQAYQTQRTFNLVLGSIAAISLLVGGIGIMNIMLATVSERTCEIGIRRAVGANKGHIMIQFLLETLFLTLIGACLGVVIGIGVSLLVSLIAGWKTIITIWSIFLSIFMATCIGILSGLYPAYRAAVMDPIWALRHY